MSSDAAPVARDRFGDLPRAAQACLVAICLAAAGVFAGAAVTGVGVEIDVVLLLVLVGLCAAGSAFEVFAPGNYSLQPNYAFFFWGAIALPPVCLPLLAVACFGPVTIMSGTALYKMAFNIANYVLAGAAAYAVARIGVLEPHMIVADTSLLVAIAGAAVLSATVNHALLVFMIASATGSRLRAMAGQAIEGAPRSIGVSLMGGCLAILWALHPPLVLLASGPLAMMAHSLWVPMLRHKAQTDAKTGLVNFGHFNGAFAELVRSCGANGTTFTLTMIDLDHLRVINNTCGHLAGDRAIRGLADELGALTPATGMAARFGGEEFCLLLPGASIDETKAVTAHLRDRLLRIDFRESDSHDELRVRFSAGVAEFPRHGATVDELLEAADAAAYLAKDRGRDRTCTADEVAAAATGDAAPADAAPADAGRSPAVTRA